MTPAARVQTAIELLDKIIEGAPAERTLTNWARSSRFAGSKDRAAIRDHVFDVLRQKNTCAALGNGQGGRALMIGLLRKQGVDPADLFTGPPYAADPLTDDEQTAGDATDVVDQADWLVPHLTAALGDDFAQVEQLMRNRAPVIVRANLRKNDRATAIEELKEEAIIGIPHPASESAIEITENPRRIKNSDAYKDGLVELQDAASQAAIELLPLTDDMRVLDYCAGGGGKLLAMAGRSHAEFFAHDAIESRLKDLTDRTYRAGIKAKILKTAEISDAAPFDLIFCDVPCSGSGTWRRDPAAKWALTQSDLDEVVALQQEILQEAAAHVRPGGYLAYATCSFLNQENAEQIDAFLAQNSGWTQQYRKSWTPLDGCDGFFTALLQAPLA